MHNMQLNLIKNDNYASRILDMVRFLAALTVFLFHFYVPLPGYQAVMVFFVISGYFISSTVLKTFKENRWSWFDYLLKRITRLWIVLIPTLLLTYAWAILQLKIFGEHELSNYLGWKTFVGNLFFMQEILVEPYGLNGPLWSLTYEFWYYILYPCLLLIFFSPKKMTKVLYGVVFIAIAILVGERIMLFFLVWLLGAMIPLLRPVKIKSNVIRSLVLFLTVIITLLSMNYENSWDSFLLDFRLGLCCAVSIYLIISMFNNSPSKVKINISKELSAFSYTLYLAHYPVAHFVLTWLVSPFWPFSETTLLIKVMIAILVLGYCWIIAMLTEKHTDKVRTFLSKMMAKLNTYNRTSQYPYSREAN